MPHLHSAILDGQSRYVYFADLGNDCIWRMNFSNEKGFDIESKTKFSTPPGSGPRHTVFHPNQKFLYVVCELTNYLLVYKVSENGDLEQVQYESTTRNETSGPKGAADIHISPDGRFVYVSTRFLDIITVFEIQSDGKVKNVQEISSGGEIPRNFVLYSPLELVLVGNQNSSNIVIFKRNKETGKLTEIEKVNANTPVCLKILD